MFKNVPVGNGYKVFRLAVPVTASPPPADPPVAMIPINTIEASILIEVLRVTA